MQIFFSFKLSFKKRTLKQVRQSKNKRYKTETKKKTRTNKREGIPKDYTKKLKQQSRFFYIQYFKKKNLFFLTYSILKTKDIKKLSLFLIVFF